jgi:TRAP-type mannitol/chloroaromatic compound transport system permease small subunit
MPAEAAVNREYRIPVVDFLNGIVRHVAQTAAWLNVVLIGVILTQVVLRYGFNRGLVPLEELMWHLYAVAFMFGLAHAVANDSHIRVDLVSMKMPEWLRHLVEILGIVLLFMPFLWIVFHHSLDWVADSFRVGEGSTSPQGLPYRWIVKSVIPISFALMFLAALARLIQETLLLFHRSPGEAAPPQAHASLPGGLFRVEMRQQRNGNHEG